MPNIDVRLVTVDGQSIAASDLIAAALASGGWTDNAGTVRLVVLTDVVAIGQAAADPGYELSVLGNVDVQGDVDTIAMGAHRVLNAIGDAEPAARLAGDILGFGPGGAGPQDVRIQRLGAGTMGFAAQTEIDIDVGAGTPEMTITPGFVGIQATAPTIGAPLRSSLTAVGNGGVQSGFECDLTITADGAGAGVPLGFGATLTIVGDAAPILAIGHSTFISYGSTGAVAAFLAGYQVNFNIDAPAGVTIGAIPLLVGSTVQGFYGAQLASTVFIYAAFYATRMPTDAANTAGAQFGMVVPNLGGGGTTDAIGILVNPQTGASGRQLGALFESPVVCGGGMSTNTTGAEQLKVDGGSRLQGALWEPATANVDPTGSPYAVLLTDHRINALPTLLAGVTFDLPQLTPLLDGQELEFFDATGNATVSPCIVNAFLGDTLEGLGSYTIATNWGGIAIVGDFAGAQWIIRIKKV